MVAEQGRVSSGLVFKHADGTPYARPSEPHAIAVHARVFSALRNMGFHESEAHRVLARVQSRQLTETALEPLLRAALVELRPRSGSSP